MEIGLQSGAEEFSSSTQVPNHPTHALPGDLRFQNAVLSSLASAKQQEQTLIRDLRYVLIGQEGIYIRYSRSGAKYSLHRSIDVRFRESVECLSRLGYQYKQLVEFIDNFDSIHYGKTMTLLCYHVRTYLLRYVDDVSQIGNEINLIQLIDALEAHISSIEQFHAIAALIVREEGQRSQPERFVDIQFDHLIESLKRDENDIMFDSTPLSNVKGGIVLNIIDHQLQSCRGHLFLTQFLESLYESVSQPYIESLNKWLNRGTIDDPFDEFSIISIRRSKFAFRSDGLIFKSANVQKLILLTGKYLSIISASSSTNPHHYVKSLKSMDLMVGLNNAYEAASASLYHYLQSKFDIDNLVQEVLNWYLIRGPINKRFNDLFFSLKRASVNNEVLSRLKDTYHSKSFLYNVLFFTFENVSIIEQLQKLIDIKAIDADEVLKSQSMNALASMFKPLRETPGVSNEHEKNKFNIANLKLEVRLPFPINEVITTSQQYELGLIFKYLTLITFIERRYENSWREIGYSVYWTWGFTNPKIIQLIRKSRILHVKFFEFLRIYSHYVKFEVIESNYNITDVKDLDKFQCQLNFFLSSTLNECLLMDKTVNQLMFNFIKLLLDFNDFIMHLRKIFVKMDNIKKSIMTESFEWINEKIDWINDRLKLYQELFDSGYKQLTCQLTLLGQLDNGKVLILKETLSSANML